MVRLHVPFLSGVLNLLLSGHGAFILYGASRGSGEDVGWWQRFTPLLHILGLALIILEAVLTNRLTISLKKQDNEVP